MIHDHEQGDGPEVNEDDETPRDEDGQQECDNTITIMLRESRPHDDYYPQPSRTDNACHTDVQ